MIKKLLFITLVLTPLISKAQYTEVINSNRPGFSESPYSVGTGVYQIEGNFFYRKADATPTFSNPKALGINLLFRTSFLFEKLELNLNTSFQQNEIAFINIFESSYNQIGFSQLTLGGKYLVYQPTYEDKSKEIRSWKKRMAFDRKRFIPAVAVYAGVNIGSVLSGYHNREGISPKIGVLLQNEFSKQFNLVTNFFYDYIGSDLPEFSYIVTATYNFDDFWSGFIEHQGLYNNFENRSNLGFGTAYLFDKNMQFNASVRATFQDNSTGYYTSIGASYRIDTHKDKYTETDEYGNEVVSENDKTSFFTKLLNGFGLFNKKKNLGSKKNKRTRKKSVTKTEKRGFLGLFRKRNKKNDDTSN